VETPEAPRGQRDFHEAAGEERSGRS
jgi:hypothetical protein